MGSAGRRVNKGLGSPIRPAKGVLSFFAQEPSRGFVPEPPLCSGGLGGGETSPNMFCRRTPGVRRAATCFVPEPPLCILLLAVFIKVSKT